jgi:serine/threonine protein kinase
MPRDGHRASWPAQKDASWPAQKDASWPAQKDASRPTEDDATRAWDGAAPTAAAPSEGGLFAAGELLAGRFRIVRLLGRGGMGEVWEAEDLKLGGRVAVKSVRPDAAQVPEALDRFLREVHLARQVTHPNVCRIFDVFPHRLADGRELTFLSMELLEGVTLRQHLDAQGRLAPSAALPLARQMAAGLEAAHQAGVVHRDFKSANVMLVPTPRGLRAVVTDFGLARAGVGETAGLTVTGAFLGTPAYMAPEQVAGEEVTPATDLYALGIVLYEMVTGELPFQGETALSVAVKRLSQEAPSPRTVVPDLDPRWEAVVARCLERRPAERFASAAEVADVLADPSSATRILAPAKRRRRGLSPRPAAGGPGRPGGRSPGTSSGSSRRG